MEEKPVRVRVNLNQATQTTLDDAEKKPVKVTKKAPRAAAAAGADETKPKRAPRAKAAPAEGVKKPASRKKAIGTTVKVAASKTAQASAKQAAAKRSTTKRKTAV